MRVIAGPVDFVVRLESRVGLRFESLKCTSTCTRGHLVFKLRLVWAYRRRLHWWTRFAEPSVLGAVLDLLRAFVFLVCIGEVGLNHIFDGVSLHIQILMILTRTPWGLLLSDSHYGSTLASNWTCSFNCSLVLKLPLWLSIKLWINLLKKMVDPYCTWKMPLICSEIFKRVVIFFWLFWVSMISWLFCLKSDSYFCLY